MEVMVVMHVCGGRGERVASGGGSGSVAVVLDPPAWSVHWWWLMVK